MGDARASSAFESSSFDGKDVMFSIEVVYDARFVLHDARDLTISRRLLRRIAR